MLIRSEGSWRALPKRATGQQLLAPCARRPCLRSGRPANCRGWRRRSQHSGPHRCQREDQVVRAARSRAPWRPPARATALIHKQRCGRPCSRATFLIVWWLPPSRELNDAVGASRGGAWRACGRAYVSASQGSMRLLLARPSTACLPFWQNRVRLGSPYWYSVNDKRWRCEAPDAGKTRRRKFSWNSIPLWQRFRSITDVLSRRQKPA